MSIMPVKLCLASRKNSFYRVRSSFDRVIFRQDKTTNLRQYFVYYRNFLCGMGGKEPVKTDFSLSEFALQVSLYLAFAYDGYAVGF